MALKDPEAKRAYMQAYRLKNLERLKEQKRLKRLADPERAKTMDHAAYLRKDKEKKKARDRARYKKHAAEEAVRKHAYYLERKDSGIFTVRAAKRRAQKRGAAVNDLTAAQWREIKATYGYRCVYCGKKTIVLEQDHIQALSKGGSHTASNIVPACLPCNRRKADGPVLTPVQPVLLTLAEPRRSA